MNSASGELTTGLSIGDAEFRIISDLIQGQFGIQLPEAKRGLVEQRLRSLVRELGCDSFAEFCRTHMRGAPSREILSRMVDRISTNHTFFWRESEHFVHFRDTVLPELAQSRTSDRDLRLWCAAAATGEEPWTLAMLVTEALGGEGWRAGVLATDISARALEIAEQGVYTAENIKGLPKALKDRWLVPLPNGGLSMHDKLRAEVTFRRLNLIGEDFPFRRPFDVVFCRNVMIYFDEPTRRDVVARIAKVTTSGGRLYIGHSETLGREDPNWRFERPGVYRRTP